MDRLKNSRTHRDFIRDHKPSEDSRLISTTEEPGGSVLGPGLGVQLSNLIRLRSSVQAASEVL